jgi:hypothetical protein
MGKRGLRWILMTLEMILYMTLQREMGHNLLGSVTLSSLGTRERKVAFRAGRTPEIHWDSCRMTQTSIFITDQQ